MNKQQRLHSAALARRTGASSTILAGDPPSVTPAMGECSRLVQSMSHQQGRTARSPLRMTPHAILHVFVCGIESREWFVEQEKFRARPPRHGQVTRDAPCRGEPRRINMRRVGESNLRQPCPAFSDAGENERQVFLCGPPRQKPWRLELVSDRLGHALRPIRSNRVESGDDLNETRFANSRLPSNEHRCHRSDVEREVIEYGSCRRIRPRGKNLAFNRIRIVIVATVHARSNGAKITMLRPSGHRRRRPPNTPHARHSKS